MTTPITVTVTPVSPNQSLLDCTECGPMGTYDAGSISEDVYAHLVGFHGVDTTTIDIRNP